MPLRNVEILAFNPLSSVKPRVLRIIHPLGSKKMPLKTTDPTTPPPCRGGGGLSPASWLAFCFLCIASLGEILYLDNISGSCGFVYVLCRLKSCLVVSRVN
jgi:hypothetical protein